MEAALREDIMRVIENSDSEEINEELQLPYGYLTNESYVDKFTSKRRKKKKADRDFDLF